MSEDNTGCGIQAELLFYPAEVYTLSGPRGQLETRVARRLYSFLSAYNCRAECHELTHQLRMSPRSFHFVSFEGECRFVVSSFANHYIR